MKVLVVGPTVPAVVANDPSLTVVHAPFIELRPLLISAAWFRIPASGTIVTSKQVIRFLKEKPPEPFFCVGERTADSLCKAFPGAHCLIASIPTQEGLLALILEHSPQTLLWPRSTNARRVLQEMLKTGGVDVIEVPLYTPVFCDQPCSLDGIEGLFFTCPSAVEAFFQRFRPDEVFHLSIRSIGPVTAACVEKHVSEASYAMDGVAY